jgi:hypothetical protein
MKRIKSFNDFINSNVSEGIFGNQFRELRHIKEGFFDKFLRNVTGKTKDRIESVTGQIELFKDLITPPKITDLPYPLKESDDELVKEVLDNFTKIVETGEWKKELADSLEYIKKNSRTRSDLIQMLMDYIKGNPDFSKVEDITDSEFNAYMKFDESDIRDIKSRIESSKERIAKSTLLKALTKIGNKEEFQKATLKEEDKEIKEPETNLLKYYDDIFSYMKFGRNNKPVTEFDIDENGSVGGSSNNIAQLMKSFIAFQGKPYKSYDYEKSNPKSLEDTLGKDYIQKIDFSKRISELENIKLLKSELERVISWSNEINSERQSSQKSIDKLDALKDTFSSYYSESELSKMRSKGEGLQTSSNESLLNLINYILDNYGDMTIKEFFDLYNSKVNKYYSEGFTTSEDYIEGHEVYKLKEGCGKVYHGGKISPTDLDFLFREQGGVFAAKLMTGANNWPTILGTKETGLLSIRITKRVYELSIKPGVKMVDDNPGGADSGSRGGLKDENRLYTPYGIKGMANEWYMNTPDGQVPDNLPMLSREVPLTKEEYIKSALQSEVVVFDRSVCDIRIVPFKELISEYERLGDANQIYKKLKDEYPMMRNMVWDLESSSPGILSKLEPFTELTDLDGIKKSIMDSKIIRKNSGKSLAEAPDDQNVDDLVEKCGTISTKDTEIKKFPTLLDYIILYNSYNI